MNTATQSLFSGLTAYWFDTVVLGWLVFGFFRGRKNGLSGELCPTLGWVLMLTAGSLLYKPIAALIGQAGCFTTLWDCRIGYLLPCLLVWMFTAKVFPRITVLLEKADYFGQWEYVFGILLGVVRYACIFIIVFSFFNAFQPTDADIKEIDKATESLGDVRFNPLKLEREVSLNSLTGRVMNKYLWFAIIDPYSAEFTVTPTETLKEKKQSMMDDITGAPRKP